MDRVESAEAVGAVLEPTGGTFELLRVRERAQPTAIRRLRRVGSLMVLTDALAIIGAYLLAHSVHMGAGAFGSLLLLSALAATAVAIAVFAAYDLYAVGRRSMGEELRHLLPAVSTSVLITAFLSAWSDVPFSRATVALSWGFSLATVWGTRIIWHRWRRAEAAAGRLSLRTLIVGTNEEAQRLAAGMASGTDYELVGHLETPQGRPGPAIMSVLGELTELEEVIQVRQVECVFVASSAVRLQDMRLLNRVARATGLEVRLSANLPETHASRIGVHAVGGLTTLSIRQVRLSSHQARIKRAFDLVVSLILGAVTAPLWIAIAVVIKLTSPGPVMFRQVRIGKMGRPFTMYKFRTMVANAEEILDELRALNEAPGPLFKMALDPRITPVGRFLRRSSLDELPQLLNVLRGEMSLVGPRPPLPAETAAYNEPWHADRLEVLPGITGLWQVSGRSSLSFEDYMRLDISYVENWSLALDMWIIAKTVPAVLSWRGAF